MKMLSDILHKHVRQLLFFPFAALVFVASASAQTVSIPGLYTTGVDNSNVLLGNNQVDAHYVVIAIPGSAPADNAGDSRTVRSTPSNPLPGGWVSNTSSARWITTPGTPTTGSGTGGNNTNRVTGIFDYRLTFTMPAGAVLSTVSITGVGAADDSTQIFVNGVLVSGQATGSYSSTAAFTLNSSNATFASGTNTIVFRVNNSGGGPTGLIITSLSGTVTVPEVGTILPVAGAMALYGLVLWRRRSRAASSQPATQR